MEDEIHRHNQEFITISLLKKLVGMTKREKIKKMVLKKQFDLD